MRTKVITKTGIGYNVENAKFINFFDLFTVCTKRVYLATFQTLDEAINYSFADYTTKRVKTVLDD